MAESATLDAAQNQEDTEVQHLRALQHANRIRLARAEMKRLVKAGRLSVAEVILDCPPHVERMEISVLLMCQKRWGIARCKRLLKSIGVPENKQIGTLTERQRLALAAVLDIRFSTA